MDLRGHFALRPKVGYHIGYDKNEPIFGRE